LTRCLPPAVTLISCLACSALEMEAICSTETSADFSGLEDVISQKMVLLKCVFNCYLQNHIQWCCLRHQAHRSLWVSEDSGLLSCCSTSKTVQMRSVRYAVLYD
jgi:hypothetical protein